MEATRHELFCSYAHEDRAFIVEFHKHLSLMQHEGLINSWWDTLIEGGQDWSNEIMGRLQRADIILLFISPDFMASDFIRRVELPIALERSRNNDAQVIPVILRPTDWQHAPFAHLQALPEGGTPVASWTDRDAAFLNVVRGIRRAVLGNEVPPLQPLLLNVPRRNLLFTGRDAVLEELHTRLQRDREVALIQALSGLGGIGKTQTAIEYAYRYQHEYSCVLWLNGEGHETAFADVSRLARELRTPACYDQQQENVRRGFLNWLAAQARWLLVIDNVEELALVREYTPPGGRGQVLITTRRDAVGGQMHGVPLDEMVPETGGYFLLKRAKRIEPETPREAVPEEEMGPAMELSELLGGLPLALDQAGGYIERKKCSLQHYMQLYQQTYKKLLAEPGFPADTTAYPYTVATTWSLAFARIAEIEQVGPVATDLLRFCAFLAPDAILVEIFELERIAALLGPQLARIVTTPGLLNEAIEALLKYSLVRRQDDVLSVHRLVQTVVRDAVSEEERSQWVERAVKVMDVVFPDPGDVDAWPICQFLLPHMLACAHWIEYRHMDTEVSTRLLDQTGYYLYNQGFYEEVRPLYEQVLAIRQRTLGNEHGKTAESLNNLAALYMSQGRYKQAEPLYEQAVAISRRVLGEEHPNTAKSLNNLAILYKLQGLYEQAQPLYEQALVIRRQALGEDHPETARSLNNLSLLYESQGCYEEAEPLCQKALTIWRQVLGEEHPDTATCLNNLACLYASQRRYEEAKPLYEQSVAIRRRVLGEEHPETAMSLNNLADLYESQGEYEQAELLYKQALAICLKVLGEGHFDTARILNNLAGLYAAQQHYEEAERLYKQALTIRQQLQGEEHPETAMCLHNLAGLYAAQQHYEQAEPLYQQALAICLKVLGEEHPTTLIVAGNYFSLLESMGKGIKKE